MWRDVLQRSVQHLREESSKILRAAPLGPAASGSMELAAIRRRQDLKAFVHGCDQDMNGLSRAYLDVDDSGRGRFYGHLNGTVNQDMKLGGRAVDRSGYAGMRTRNRQTLFGTMYWDTEPYAFLRLRIRGPPPNSSASNLRYFVNIQTDGPVQSDLYQHRLWLGDSGTWEDILIPFADFALTNAGQISEQQLTMMRERVRTVGVSVMLPVSTAEGKQVASLDQDHPFDLGIESFECTNIQGELKRPLPV